MGTTVVAAAVLGEELVIAHAGDSRAYLAGPEGLRLLTRDHSVVQAMVDAGTLSPEQAAGHPRRNYITRALGVDEHIEIEFTQAVFGPEDRLLLCTDGLSNYVPAETVLSLMRSDPADFIPKRLIDAANDGGGGDNITAVVITR